MSIIAQETSDEVYQASGIKSKSPVYGASGIKSEGRKDRRKKSEIAGIKKALFDILEADHRRPFGKSSTQ